MRHRPKNPIKRTYHPALLRTSPVHYPYTHSYIHRVSRSNPEALRATNCLAFMDLYPSPIPCLLSAPVSVPEFPPGSLQARSQEAIQQTLTSLLASLHQSFFPLLPAPAPQQSVHRSPVQLCATQGLSASFARSAQLTRHFPPADLSAKNLLSLVDAKLHP